MAKKCINLTIDPKLLEQIDNKRRELSVEEQRDVSRSAYMSELIAKGLTK